MKKSTGKAFHTAILGIFTAIIFIQSFVPFLGNIPIPPLNPNRLVINEEIITPMTNKITTKLKYANTLYSPRAKLSAISAARPVIEDGLVCM